MYAGLWIRPPKPPESTTRTSEGLPAGTLIHDDEAARALGYKGGLVGGPMLATVTISAIDASFGHTWYESGAYSIRYAKPVYDREEVRVVWEESEPGPGDKRKITLWVERRDGERVAFGWAALGESGQKLTPPWQRSPTPPADSADDLLPEIHVGDRRPPFECRASEDYRWMASRLDYVEDRNLWYRVASPWGAPIVSVMGIYDLITQRPSHQLQSQPTRSRLQTTMAAGFDVVVYGPLFRDQVYHVEPWLCEKGQSARSVYWTEEYTIDDHSGRRVAVVRSKLRHLISDLVDAESRA